MIDQFFIRITLPIMTQRPRGINFGAGPAELPLSVLKEFQTSLLNHGNTGQGVLEYFFFLRLVNQCFLLSILVSIIIFITCVTSFISLEEGLFVNLIRNLQFPLSFPAFKK